MQTVELIIKKNNKPKQILNLLRDKKLSRGDKLKIRNNDSETPFDAAVVLILFIVLWYFVSEEEKAKRVKGKKSFGEEIEDIIFDKSLSPEVMEKQIKEEYGVDVTVEYNKEETEWRNFSSGHFLKNYSDHEPEYNLSDVREPNPEYKKWKKGM